MHDVLINMGLFPLLSLITPTSAIDTTVSSSTTKVSSTTMASSTSEVDEGMLTSVTQSLITFLVVFFLCTTGLLLGYLAKQGPPSRFRLPMSYHYSALSQSELDPEEEEAEEAAVASRGQVAFASDSDSDSDDVFYASSQLSPEQPATIDVIDQETREGQTDSSSSTLLQESADNDQTRATSQAMLDTSKL